MKYNPLNCQLQSGKKTAIVAAAKANQTLGNASSGVVLPRADTLYYQVDKHGDYVQETN